jgi:hypothetical protein
VPLLVSSGRKSGFDIYGMYSRLEGLGREEEMGVDTLMGWSRGPNCGGKVELKAGTVSI